MYNRYNDIGKFIIDGKELKIVNKNEVYISREEDYDISIVLEDSQIDEFEDLKKFIILITKHICQLDNMAQNFNKIYSKKDSFPYELAIIYIDEMNTNQIRFGYWGTNENTQFEVVFEYKDNEFILKSYGMIKDINEDWFKGKR